MKKKLHMILCLVLALALPLAAFAEEEMDLVLEGLVTEIVEGGFLMEDAEMGTVMLNVSETTVWDGMISSETLEKGQYVIVQYDGRMTRSLPPQAHADRVSSYVLEGTVNEVYEDGSFLLEGDPIHGEVIVTAESTLAPLYAGMSVTVYYDGVMALSLPGQANARWIVVPQLKGTVGEVTEEGFLLTDAEGVQYQVIMDENTVVGLMEEAVIEETAETVLEEDEIPAEGTPEELPEAAETTETVEWGEGDTVTVYYNGMLTRSEPAQLAALEIIVER